MSVDLILGLSPPINIEVGEIINQTILGEGSLSRTYTINQSDLVGSLYVKQHDLDLLIYDVTVTDSQGEIDIPWKPLGRNHIQLDFIGLTPISQTYTLLIQV